MGRKGLALAGCTLVVVAWAVRQYHDPAGRLASVADTGAF